MGPLTDAVFQTILNIAAALAIIALLWFRDFIVYRILLIGRWLRTALTKRRYILIWLDEEPAHAKKLAKKLGELRADGHIYRVIPRPRSLLFYHLRGNSVSAVIMLVTDVGKLADDPRTRTKIQARLREYIDAGGALIGSHDLIYRRSRNDQLQMMFGCETTHFKRADVVAYNLQISQEEHPLRRELPDSFELNDDEVCWGEWAPDVSVIFATDDEDQHPLVVAREYAQGRLVWLNSGDRGDWLCRSIATPQPQFLILLRNALDWCTEK
jgi:hypothetical protein